MPSATQLGAHALWRGKFPGDMDIHLQIRVAPTLEVDAKPAAMPDIGRLKEHLGRFFNQICLEARRHRQPYGDMTIVMMVIGEHHKDFLVDKEGRLAVRESFTH